MSTALAAMYGALITMCVVAALIFARYWWFSRDRFFIWFASAFATFAVNWLLVVADSAPSEHTPYVYGVRLLGFLQILAAILFKNQVRNS